MQKFIVKIEEENAELIQDNNLECYILTSTLKPEFIKKFAELAALQDKIVLLEGDLAAPLCKELNLDGVVVDISRSEKISAELTAVRNLIGSKKFMGVISRNRRHEAMLAAESEPDFMAFRVWEDGIENVKELVAWYNELFLIQSAIICVDKNIDFASFASDIVILNDKEYKILVAKNKSLD